MARRTPRSVKRSCDKLFSELIRSRGRCERCGSKNYLQCAHIYSRKFGSVRFDEENALCLCAKCHRWGHDNPLEFARFVEKKRVYDRLVKKKNKIVKRKLADWLELEQEIKAKLTLDK